MFDSLLLNARNFDHIGERLSIGTEKRDDT
jgi:hypothetical protein